MNNNLRANLSNFLLLCSLIVAMILANYTQWYFKLIDNAFFPFPFEDKSLKEMVKNILMIVFFLYVGIELKIEFSSGSLSKTKQALLPCIAAVGGVVTPALIYYLINLNYPENFKGFGIPCATDIAFAICLFNLVKKFLPDSARALLLAIAIFDDLIAILIIALFYNNNLEPIWILFSLLPLCLMIIFGIKRITNLLLYISLLIILFVCFFKAGITTTLSGLLLGLLMPLNSKNHTPFLKPLFIRLEPIVQFLILPIFVFTASGVSFHKFTFDIFRDPIVLGIIWGLFLGKQLGIVLFTYIASKLRLANLPLNCSMKDVYTISCIAGIGFTMSLFVGMLAFIDSEKQNLVKIGVIFGSLISALYSIILVRCFYKKDS